MKFTSTKKITIAAILIALGVICSPLSINVGFAKCFPIQHLVNVLAGVMFGPLYAVIMAFATSLIRVLMGMGTLLAFPGSMVGALCCGLLYKYTHRLWAAYLGEIIGTGVLGALVAFPVAAFVMGKEVALFGFVLPFSASTVVGATLSVVLIKSLSKTHVLDGILKPKIKA
ncbi:MAG: energy coupling factor transporter S component ThiW [Oscillospiraceae bacterium]